VRSRRSSSTSKTSPTQDSPHDVLSMTNHAARDRAPGRRGSGTASSSFRDRVSAARGQGACRDGDRLPRRARPQPGFPSNHEWLSPGARSAAVPASAPCNISTGRFAGRSQSCAAWSYDVAAASPPCCLSPSLSVPSAGRSTAVPTVRSRSALRAALRQANSRTSSTPSIDRASCTLRAHGDADAGRSLCPATGPQRTS
jgi:hypothetical protein